MGRARPRAGSESSTSSEMTLSEPPEPDKDETEGKAFGGFFLEIEQGVSGGWIWMVLSALRDISKLTCFFEKTYTTLEEWIIRTYRLMSGVRISQVFCLCTTTFEIRESKWFCVSRWLCLHESGEGRKAFFQTACG